MKGLEGEASTELTLGLPGDKLPVQLERNNNNNSNKNPVHKRGFCDAGLDLKLGAEPGSVENKKPTGLDGDNDDEQLDRSSSSSKAPPPKEQLVGWPPVRPSRKNIVMKSKSKFVKVAVDGAPYLRKLDLHLYSSYRHLFNSSGHFFSCNLSNDGKLKDPVNGSELVPTYEDKDGDWMMVGDTPWKMFVESCQRIRFMKGSEAVGLGDAEPRSPSKVD